MLKKILDFFLDEQSITIQFQLIRTGNDFLLLIAGGDAPHIGAVTLGDSSGSQTFARQHHKEDVVTESLYRRLAFQCPGGLCIICGIHIDDIRKEQIAQTVSMCQAGAETIEKWWKENE